MPNYLPKAIEPRWQKFWEDNKTFRTPDRSNKPKYYILDMFPYPSGAGLHVGHPEGYTATDILARYKRMKGFNVLHPMGWDAFGLPAEQYAIKEGKHPHGFTQANIDTFRRQIKSLGFSYDWDREIDTTDPNYYKWTQWIFLQLYDTWYDPKMKKGRPLKEMTIPREVKARGLLAVQQYQANYRLAYQAEIPVNWCPALGTVLANEEVKDGKSERGGHPVVRMPLRQWLLRITDYAERLLEDLDQVDWPESIKKMQRDWIGKSEGAEVDFQLQNPPLGTEGLGTLRVFTTRPDTLFGATYMVLAPEHPLVPLVTTPGQRQAVAAYQDEASRKNDLERTELAKTKTGVFTGAYAINPVNREPIPIWIADYVLISYGTGAIMAVPAHDERDNAFARQYKLPIKGAVLPPVAWLQKTKIFQYLEKLAASGGAPSIAPKGEEATLEMKNYNVVRAVSKIWDQFNRDPQKVVEQLFRTQADLFEECFSDEGTAINSGSFNNLPTAEFKQQIAAWLTQEKKGQTKINYKLRDWLFSRQRYWGEPFPVAHELDPNGQPTGVMRALAQLPVKLPDLVDFAPTGKPEPPLGKAKVWVEMIVSDKRYRRETNTMPQWAGSCWYYLRYIDPHNENAFCDPDKLKEWLPVDLYVGGAEHAVLHLLYSRFWHKVLYDRGYVPGPEPFKRLVNQGMILGETEYVGFKLGSSWLGAENVDFDGDSATLKNTEQKVTVIKLDEEQVEKRGEHFVMKELPQARVMAQAFKMSKSRGNVINPDSVVEKYGADSLRLYEMFMGPLEATKPWNMRGVEGVYRFLNRVWRLIVEERTEEPTLAEAVQDIAPDRDTLRILHQTIKRVTEDIEGLSFNTAISAMMELTNFLTPLKVRPKSVLENFVLLLGPFAPHLAEELWQVLGHQDTLAYEAWPAFDEAHLQVETVEVPVQINGKIRCKLSVPAQTDPKTLEKLAIEDKNVKLHLDGKTIKKVVVVAGRLVNIVVG